MNSSPRTSRESLVASLRGQKMVIPDIHRILEGWDEDLNPAVNWARFTMDYRIKSLYSGKLEKKLRAADLGTFVSYWYPQAEPKRLRTLSHLALFCFAWDDETDTEEFSSMPASFDMSQHYRDTARSYISHCLGLACQELERIPQQPTIKGFKDIGEMLLKSCSLAQRHLLKSELEFFIEMGKEEHAASVSHRLLTSEEYRNIRSGTSGVGVLLALTDYAYGFSLPEKYYPANNSQMGVIWTATNIIVSTINDLLSLKKEIAQGQIDTLIPLLYVEHGCDLQRAVNEATTMLEEEISKFERAEANLLATEADEDTKEQLRLFIRGSWVLDAICWAVRTYMKDWKSPYEDVKVAKFHDLRICSRDLGRGPTKIYPFWIASE